MKTIILAAASALAVLFTTAPAAAQDQQRPSWYGRETASTARPIRTVTPQAVEQERVRPVRGRQDGWRPQRSLYLDPYGNVTVWAGDAPYWLRSDQGGQNQSYGYQGQVPAQGNQRYGPSNRSGCASSGGPATAGSAIASAPGAFRSGC